MRTANSSLKIVTLQNLIYARSCRQNSKWVLSNGCFGLGLSHPGHVIFLEQASSLAEVLVVAINSDASYARVKRRPVPIPFHDRARMIAALACVDYVVEMDEDTPHTILQALTPAVLVKSSSSEYPVGHEVVTGYGGQVIVLPSYGSYSTSEILGWHTDIAK